MRKILIFNKEWYNAKKKGINRLMRHLIVYFPPFFGFILLYKISHGEWFKSEAWILFFNSIAIALITGGILAFTINYLKFFDFFRIQLENIVFGKEFLEKRNDIEELWANISRILYKKKFPELSKDLEVIIKDHYFPTDSSFYTNIFEMDIKIDFFDESKEYVDVYEITKQKIKSHTKNNVEVKFNTDINLLKNGEEDKSELEVEFLKINDQTIYENKGEGDYADSTERLKLQIKNDNSQDDKKCIRGVMNLSGSTNYLIVRKLHKRYSLKANPIKSVRASHIFKRIIVNIVIPSNLRIEFASSGTIENFESFDTVDDKMFKYEYNKILLPKQGFAFGITKV